VSAAQPQLYRSSGVRGYTSRIADHPQHIEARKLEREVQVQFTEQGCSVRTPEGTVQARPGDAIVTGIAGERWRVSRAHFDAKYQAVPPTRAGESGTYRSLRTRILALSMSEPFEVMLADGVSRLTGRPGDWLVDYGDGSLGIVTPEIFAVTYEILE
jgi:hypothetical protein